MFYDPRLNNHGLALDPFKALVAPRPIAWISTISATGQANLAPYSFFNAFAEHPHYLAFGSGGYKDTIANIDQTGAFAVNLVTYDLREAMNKTSDGVAAGVDEFALAGLTKAACQNIAAPRVAESPVCFECEFFQKIDLPKLDGTVDDWMVIGRVVGIHLEDQFIVQGRVDTVALRPIARLGYSEYATVEDKWRMRRSD
jgi:flavin reductase (DIM6/NTAB) family NADH-FMN oxidoreductase RutF